MPSILSSQSEGANPSVTHIHLGNSKVSRGKSYHKHFYYSKFGVEDWERQNQGKVF